MKKIFVIIIILFISFISANTIFAVMSDRQETEKIYDVALVKTRKVALLAKEAPKLPDSILLDVPLLKQMDPPLLYNGCEVTSLAMILNYHGIKVTKNELAQNIKTVPLTFS